MGLFNNKQQMAEIQLVTKFGFSNLPRANALLKQISKQSLTVLPVLVQFIIVNIKTAFIFCNLVINVGTSQK